MADGGASLFCTGLNVGGVEVLTEVCSWLSPGCRLLRAWDSLDARWCWAYGRCVGLDGRLALLDLEVVALGPSPTTGLAAPTKTHTSPLPYKTLVSVSAIDQNLFKTEDAATCKNYWDKVFFFNDTGEDIHDAIAGKAGALDAKRKWDSVSSVVAI